MAAEMLKADTALFTLIAQISVSNKFIECLVMNIYMGKISSCHL